MAISILTTHLISSIPAWPNFLTIICLRKIMLKKIPCIKALKVIYFLIFLDDHEYSDAYMLQTQR